MQVGRLERMRVLRVPDREQLGREAAGIIAKEAVRAIRERGRFTLALSGGATPSVVYRALLIERDMASAWRRTHVFWTDERCVPPSHPRSNYGNAVKALLSHVEPSAVVRIRCCCALPGVCGERQGGRVLRRRDHALGRRGRHRAG